MGGRTGEARGGGGRYQQQSVVISPRSILLIPVSTDLITGGWVLGWGGGVLKSCIVPRTTLAHCVVNKAVLCRRSASFTALHNRSADLSHFDAAVSRFEMDSSTGIKVLPSLWGV